ncbi:phosphoribosylanthranilate isomerase [Danxiaibacter flavus]|uniref:N-(5'-phosphoribosyl)anthranilate isomerase n=1 Tax=Danxiaibacter flavus TaxID=3049108 RepID=A0ABV3ZBW6_9BACT|nr:phosphoribosylanthranilate isomerase [Chitinophagaceae bacterium DXS]
MDEQQLNSGKENVLTKIRIKVCGMTMPSQVQQLDEMGVDFAGFIFYPKSPRYALKQMTANELKKIKGKINKVGVFVNAEVDEVLRIVDECGLYLVQLHGDETPRTCEMISNYVSVIKAFRISEDDNIEWKIREYYDAADMYLFDTEGAGYGGTGKKFNWQLLKGQNIRKSFFLSGGIQPGDESAIAEFVKDPVAKDLFSLDINSKFEVMPGVKDMDKVREFVENLKGKQR